MNRRTEEYQYFRFFYLRLKIIAIELKLGKFKAAYKGQMELYMRWADRALAIR
jgi:predicted nuclease of restriction endonuclease-like (RecB) superfamily